MGTRLIFKTADFSAIGNMEVPIYETVAECNILEKDENGNLQKHRPDRVIIKNGTCIVIDFKFAKESEEYTDQVRRYMILMRKMGYENILGYLWYIGDNKTKVVEVTL
jgi:CRISPR/Cas system-associated exonuclease Cas4 (RecB family)